MSIRNSALCLLSAAIATVMTSSFGGATQVQRASTRFLPVDTAEFPRTGAAWQENPDVPGTFESDSPNFSGSSGYKTDRLLLHDFGFTLPASTIINEVSLIIWLRGHPLGPDSHKTLYLGLRWGGDTPVSLPSNAPSGDPSWPRGTNELFEDKGPFKSWNGILPTAADINSPNFGVVISGISSKCEECIQFVGCEGSCGFYVQRAEITLNVTLPPTTGVPVLSTTTTTANSVFATSSVQTSSSVQTGSASSLALATSGSSSLSVVPDFDRTLATETETSDGVGSILIIVLTVGSLCILCIIATIVFVRLRPDRQPMQELQMPPGVYDPLPSPGASAGGSMAASPGTSYGNLDVSSWGATSGAFDMNSVRLSKHSLGEWEIDFSDLTFSTELGRGAFGVVYEGTWRLQKVAVKQILGEHSQQQVDEFLHEVMLMKALRPHGNVVGLLGVCTTKYLCIVTELLPKGNLHSFLRTLESLELSQAVAWGKNIAAGMSHLHSEQIIHRDLAARNVLLTHDLTAKISDFGLSRLVGGPECDDGGQTTATTGPLKWMAPECISARIYSTRSDSWAWAVTFIEILTRNVPYPGVDGMNVAIGVTTAGLTPEVPPNTPPAIEDVLRRCWLHNPDQRPEMNAIYRSLSDVKL